MRKSSRPPGLLSANGQESVAAPVSVAICVPAMNTVETLFAYDLAVMMAYTATNSPHIALSLYVEQSSLLARQRQALVAEAVRVGNTHLLFLDSDMRFPPDTLERLVARKLAIVGANYVTKSVPPVPVTMPDPSNLKLRLPTRPDSPAVEQVFALGFGCCLIETAVFGAFPVPHFLLGFSPKAMDFVGEDVYFFRNVFEQKIAVHVDHELSREVAHIGRWEFSMEHLLPEETPPAPDLADAGSETL